MITPSIRLRILASVSISLVDAFAATSRRIRTRIWPFGRDCRTGHYGSYRDAQKRRAAKRIGNLADYAWYGSAQDWQRAKALALAGREDLIEPTNAGK